MTAAAILDACCPPLSCSLVEQLLSRWHVTPDEAAAIRRIVDAWGDEPANGRGQADLRAEISGRIGRYLQSKRSPSAGAVLH